MSLSLKGLAIGNGGGGGYDPNDNSVANNNYAGFVYYGDSQFTASNPQEWRGGQVQQIKNNGEVDFSKSFISRDLKDHDFMVNDKFTPKTTGDTYLLRLTVAARSSTMGNTLTVRLRAPDVIQQDTSPFLTNSGDETLFTFNYHCSCLQSFKDSGGIFEGWCDYDATVWGVGLLIIPVTRL